MSRRNAMIAGGCGLAALIVAISLWPRVESALAPLPVGALVAVEPAVGGRAAVGPLELEAGEAFELHAVLLARSGDEPVYYSHAPRLFLADGTEVPVRPVAEYRGGSEVRVLWFSVEAAPPYLEAATAAERERDTFRDVFQPEWPRAWSIPGRVEAGPAHKRLRAREAGMPGFGVQRYQVRIEVFGPESQIVARHRVTSPGAGVLPGALDSVPGVTAALAGPLALPSRAFGMTQIEGEAVTGDIAWLERRFRMGLAFSRLLLLRRYLDASELTWNELEWRAIDLDAGPVWGGEDGAGAGDLLRVGHRVVYLVRDGGAAGVVDNGDLGFDFDRGAAVLLLGDVFTGDGLVEWARLAPAAPH